MRYSRYHPACYQWTPERLVILRRLYQTATWGELTEALGASEGVISYQAQKLGLERPRIRTGIWTNEKRVQKLVRLWEQGFSCSEIAKQLGGGINRNQVIGKIHRLGLSGRTTAPTKTKKPRTKKPREAIARPAKVSIPLEVIPLPPEPKSDMARKKLVGLEKVDCRWPVGDPKSPDFGFCADERLPGSSYCHRHTLRAFQLPKVPERVAAHIQEDIQVDSETQREKETV